MVKEQKMNEEKTLYYKYKAKCLWLMLEYEKLKNYGLKHNLIMQILINYKERK